MWEMAGRGGRTPWTAEEHDARAQRRLPEGEAAFVVGPARHRGFPRHPFLPNPLFEK